MSTRRFPPVLRIALGTINWFVRGVLVLIFLICLVIGFGTSSEDNTRLAHFTSSVQTWQTQTEFREVARQYVTSGSDAMRSRPMGFTSAEWIMWIRSLPVMPKEFAVNPTSALHYQQFSKGPLSAYLHLCSEVELFGKNPDGTPDFNGGYLPELEGTFGDSGGAWEYDKLHAYLAKQQWDYEVAKDAGAVESLKSVLTDTDVSRRYGVRVMHINQELQSHIDALATELKIVHEDGKPKSPDEMTPDEQYAVYNRLDDHVRRNNFDLWRTKQVSDFIGGIWGQVFSTPYTQLLSPYVLAVTICRWVVLGMLTLLYIRAIWKARAMAKKTIAPEGAAHEVSGS